MKRIIALTIVLVVCAASAAAQKKKPVKPKPRPASKPAAPAATNNSPRIVGTQVEIVTKNGDHLVGELLDLSSFSIRIRADRLESSIAMDTVASLSFGGGPAVSPKSAALPASADFARDAAIVLGSFQSVASNLQSGIDYTEFGRQVTELRRGVEKFVSKYAGTENSTELRVVSLITAGLTDYNWARTVWTLKFGRSSDGMAAESESPALADALAAYPDVKTAAANGNKYGIEKVIGLLWRKAADKSSRARSLLGSAN